MKRTAVTLTIAALSIAAADRGLPARPAPMDYPVQDKATHVTIAAEYMPPEQVRGSFATDLSRYLVFEVALYPTSGRSIDVQHLDFALKADGRTVRPATAQAIAGSNQRRSRARSNDILLYPSVGVTTGSWGTGTSVGVGVGMGGGAPGPASTDRDLDVMRQEIEDRILPEVKTARPVAGYLFFPADSSRRRASSYVLEYTGPDGEVRVTVPLPEKN